MKLLTCISLLLVSLTALTASPATDKIIDRARATIGTEEALQGLITLQLKGKVIPADPKMPEASLIIIARKPSSQRLEVRVGDLVESTIVRGIYGAIIRSNENPDSQQVPHMRPLSEKELKRVKYNTRQFFAFFEPDFKNGETVEHAGIEQHRGVRCHKLIYTHPEGMQMTRFFSVNDDTLVGSITDTGVESVEIEHTVIDGIRFPTKVEYYENQKMLHSIEIAEIKANKPLPVGIFEIPETKK